MFDLVIVIRVAAVALLLPEILLVLRRAGRRSEAVWFAAFLGSLAVLAAVAGSRIGDVALLPTASAMLWAAGTYLDERDGRAAPWWWHVLAVLVVGGGVALAVSAVAGEVAATAAAAV
ncbi:MAG: hypothetical protein CL878_00005, partial [Dehalococcoidia bacterium]|nr:hypothetical protein [Dehalococcoidia bacterium]